MKKLNLTQDKSIRVGIDIGTSKICCAIAARDSDSDRLRLLGIGSAASTGMKRGSIIHRDKVIDEIEQAVSAAETMANLKVEHAWLSLSGEHIRGINTQGAIAIRDGHNGSLAAERVISKEDIRKALEYAKAINFPVDRDILHVLPQEYVIDTMNGIKDPVGMNGRRLEARVHLVTMATSAATNLVNCTEELGIRIDGLIYQGIASALSTLDQDEKELGVAVVDIGAGTTDITVFYDGGVRHTGVIPIGASSITNDIAVMLQIGKEDAESIKTKYASAKASMASADLDFKLPNKDGELTRSVSEHELSRYVEARMVEILQLIKREMNRADLQEALTYGVVLTGGGAQLKNVAGLAEEILDMRVRIGMPRDYGGAVDIASQPLFATVLGLLRWLDTQVDLHTTAMESISPGAMLGKVKNWFKEFF